MTQPIEITHGFDELNRRVWPRFSAALQDAGLVV